MANAARFWMRPLGVLAVCVATDACEACPTLDNLLSTAERSEALASTTATHDALPLGVKSGTNWREHGRRNVVTKPADYKAFVPWGQIFPEEGVIANAAAKVELRDMRAYLLRRGSGAWERVSRSDWLEGRTFRPNFENNESTPTNIIYGTGLTSATLDPERPFHFWPKEGRVKIDGADVAAVLVLYRARLASGSPRNARYLFGAGADYWKTVHSRWQNYTTNSDAGIGRLRHLTSRWRTVFIYTGTRADFGRCVYAN